MNKETVKKLYDYYTNRIDQIIKAQDALMNGGVKSYTIGNEQITRFDLSQLSRELDEAVEKQSYYNAILHGKPTRAMVGIVPTDK